MATQKFYVRKVNATASSTYNTEDKWGLVLKEFDFPVADEVKDMESNNFLDEHGEDEYTDGKLYLKAYTIKPVFCIKGTKDYIYKQYKAFRDYLIGVDGKGTAMYIYSEWHGFGRKNVRFSKTDDKAEYVQLSDNEFYLSISLEFKVNDPVSEVELKSGKLYDKA